MSIYEIHAGSWRDGPELPRDGRRADRRAGRDRVHPRGVPAAGRPPVRGVLGLPGHVVLRAGSPVRLARRPAVPDRPAAPGRYRRDPGLGARPLPEGRVGAGPVRRHVAVRARRPAPRRAARLGHVRLRLRPSRGAQLPGCERAVLARGVPRRRPAGGRGRLDAVPGLLPRGRRVAAEHLRRQREPGRGGLPAGDERDRRQAGARRVDDRRGVHRLAGRHPADASGRPGLPPEVEHGLDARHAWATSPGTRSTGRGTTTR